MDLESEPIEDIDECLPIDDAQQPMPDEQLFSEDLGMGGYGGDSYQQPMEKHSDLLKKLTNFNSYLANRISKWLGLKWDDAKGDWIRDKYATPIMNYKCANWCVGYLETYCRDNNIITNIGQKEYVNLMQDVIENVWLNIGGRAEEFGIPNLGDVLRICVELEHATALILMGAGDGKYNELLGTITTRHENVSNMPNQYGMTPPAPQGVGVFGKVKGFFTGR